jgi:hypothetical protein
VAAVGGPVDRGEAGAAGPEGRQLFTSPWGSRTEFGGSEADHGQLNAGFGQCANSRTIGPRRWSWPDTPSCRTCAAVTTTSHWLALGRRDWPRRSPSSPEPFDHAWLDGFTAPAEQTTQLTPCCSYAGRTGRPRRMPLTPTYVSSTTTGHPPYAERTERRGPQGGEPLHPSVDGHMVDVEPTPGKQTSSTIRYNRP